MSGIRIGYWDQSYKHPLSFPTGQGHGLLCCPTRGGKGRDFLTQIALSFEGSCYFNDPKGQLAAVSARYRRDVLKQDVYILNPFKILPDYLGKFFHAQYDPIASQLDPESESFAADADNLLEGLMPHGGPEVHWVDSARLLGSGIGMHLRRSMDRWSLPDVYSTISDSHLHEFCEDELAKVTDEADPDAPPDETVEHIVNRLSRFRGSAAKDNREIRSVVSTAITKLGWLSNRPIAENMRKSTVDFKQMRKRPMTVYVVAPGRYLRTCATWLRTITNSWADACLQEGEGDVPVLGVLDEFKMSVGNLTSVNTLNAMGAGYGVTVLTVIQDLNQLRELMPDGWQTYLANSAFQIFCAPGAGDLFTSEHISKMTGTTEVRSVSKSTGKSGSGIPFPIGLQGALNSLSAMTSGNGDQLNISQQARRYMLPEEIREMSDTEALTFARGVKGVIRSGRRPYYDDPEYFLADGTPKFDKDPYHAKKSR